MYHEISKNYLRAGIKKSNKYGTDMVVSELKQLQLRTPPHDTRSTRKRSAQKGAKVPWDYEGETW